MKEKLSLESRPIKTGDEFHKNFICISSGALGVLVLVSSFIRGYFFNFPFDKLTIPIVVGVVFVLISIREKYGRSVIWHAYFILFSFAFIGVNAGIVNGGVRAPTAAGIIMIPLLGASVLGKRGAIVGLILSLLSLTLISLADVWNLTSPLQEGAEKYTTFIFLGGSVITTLIVLSYEKARIENERQLAELHQKLYSSSKLSSIGEMAASIAHEINNPLSVIIGRGKILNNEITSQSDFANSKELQNYSARINKIIEMSERISKIVNSLLNFSRQTDQEQKVSISISEVIEKTSELCKEKHKMNGIVFNIELLADCEVLFRPVQLEQVLYNLLSNAADAIAAKSEKWIQLKMHIENKYCHITVTDSGNGIQSEVVDKMMEPFFTTKPLGKGTGLGLSISKSIVEAHGGQLIYDNSKTNTTFLVMIPILTFNNENKAS